VNVHLEDAHLVVFEQDLGFWGAAVTASFCGVHHLSKLLAFCANTIPAAKAKMKHAKPT
jgi:hypothetical protein